MTLNLLVPEGTSRRAVIVDTFPFTIGRATDNHLRLADPQVSRRHAEVIESDGSWRVRDCQSRLGTFVNDRRVDECAVMIGDRLRVGGTELVLASADGTVTSSALDFRHLNALFTGLRALGTSRVLDEVLELVLDTALDVTGAERGFVLLPNDQGHLGLAAARARGGITLATAQTSQRIPDEVFATGVDQVVTDLLDQAYAPAHMGTVALGIRNVVCTPLNVGYGSGDQRRVGVLYLDSREKGYLQSLSTLHVLATEAAVVIDNARLYREVVEKERIAQELRIASEMQQALLAARHHVAAAGEIAAVTRPCRDVGGDMFDYEVLPDGRMRVLIADVAGKGTSAALLTAVVQGLFAAEVSSADDPAAVLSRINRGLCRRSVAARFVTAGYIEAVPQEHRLLYCTAGHNPPLLFTRGSVARLDVGGTVLGLFDQCPLDTGEVAYESGDLLVMFSDGVTEAVNAAGDEFGEEQIIAAVDPVVSRPAQEVIAAIEAALSAFCGTTPARDDVTAIAIKLY